MKKARIVACAFKRAYKKPLSIDGHNEQLEKCQFKFNQSLRPELKNKKKKRKDFFFPCEHHLMRESFDSLEITISEE